MVVLDIQHAGKPDSPFDRGAQLGTLTEVWATRRLALGIEEHLDAARIAVHVLRDGTYPARHLRCNALAPALYVACHFDAGIGKRGDRGAVFYWPGSVKGAAAAAQLAAAAHAVVPWNVTAVPATKGTYDGVRACMAGVAAPALVLELGFCDGKLGELWLQSEAHLQTLGDAVGRGIVAALRARA